MKPISVVIPTAGRPEFLHNALQSVARQTAIHEIQEVLVSENLGNSTSKTVCGQFPHLPIKYVLQDPPLTPVENYAYLLREGKGELIAFLCDDDWWNPGHLQIALHGLRNHSEAVVWFSSCYYSTSTVLADGWLHRPSVVWLAAGQPSLTKIWTFTPIQVLVACWPLTPFSFSCMVGYRDALSSALTAVASVHPYQVDRLLYAELATKGLFLYEPLVLAFIRWHQETASMRTDMLERERLFREGTTQIGNIALARGVDLAAEWRKCLVNVDDQVQREVARFFGRAMDRQQLSEHGFSEFIPTSPYLRAFSHLMRLGKSVLHQ